MSWDYAEQKVLNAKHLKNPIPGDYWEEHLVGVCVVLVVRPKEIIVCREKTDCPPDCWTWNLNAAEVLSRGVFEKFLSCEYAERSGETWAYVHPKHHEWAVKEYLKEAKA